MSRCWTVTHAGMVPGIAVSGPHHDRLYIAVGNEYTHRDTPDGHPDMLLKRESVSVQFDPFKPPATNDKRLMAASLTRNGNETCLRRPRPNDRGVLIFVDTEHTYPCEAGGYWTVNDSKFLVTAAYGSEGHKLYTVRSADPYGEATQEVDEEVCYRKGLLLLLPGGRLTVTFNAPGRLVGEVAFDGDEPSFEITKNEVDEDYEYEPRDYAAEKAFASEPTFRGSFGDPFDDDL